eukprot:7117250-Alexandrium_andersonii.AAC.1
MGHGASTCIKASPSASTTSTTPEATQHQPHYIDAHPEWPMPHAPGERQREGPLPGARLDRQG